MPIETKPLTPAGLAAVTRGAKVIERDAHGDKVLMLADGRYLKYFRRKRTWNRDLLVPAAVRFTRHARHLHRLGIPTLEVTGLHRVIGTGASVAIYEPLPGRSLRQLLAGGEVDGNLMYRVGVFIARLHRQGVYFRSLHPGNIIVDGNRLGLIDVLDLRPRRWSLSRWARRRNWRHLLRCPEDRPYLHAEHIDELLMGYRDAADLPRRESRRVVERARRALALG